MPALLLTLFSKLPLREHKARTGFPGQGAPASASMASCTLHLFQRRTLFLLKPSAFGRGYPPPASYGRLFKVCFCSAD